MAITAAGEKVLRELDRAKAYDRASARQVSSTPAAAPLYNTGILDKATKRPAGGSQVTVYWITPAGRKSLRNLKGK